MRRSLWVLEVRSKNGKWGRTEYTGPTKKRVTLMAPGWMAMDSAVKPGALIPYRVVKYVPRDQPWWRFWE